MPRWVHLALRPHVGFAETIGSGSRMNVYWELSREDANER